MKNIKILIVLTLVSTSLSVSSQPLWKVVDAVVPGTLPDVVYLIWDAALSEWVEVDQSGGFPEFEGIDLVGKTGNPYITFDKEGSSPLWEMSKINESLEFRHRAASSLKSTLKLSPNQIHATAGDGFLVTKDGTNDGVKVTGVGDGAEIHTTGSTQDLDFGAGSNTTRMSVSHDGPVYITAYNKTIETITDDKEKWALVVGSNNASDMVGILTEDLAVAQIDFWPDYVFEEDYALSSLEEMETYLKEHRHLPGMMSESEVKEKGYYHVHDALIGQLKNLEEQVLHNIAQEKKIRQQELQLKAQAEKLEQLEQLVQQLISAE